jgi:integrase
VQERAGLTDKEAEALALWGPSPSGRGYNSVALALGISRSAVRHSYVSLMHDAGFSLERIGDYVGHSSAYMTDAYRHLLEGHEAEAAELFENYLARNTTGA